MRGVPHPLRSIPSEAPHRPSSERTIAIARPRTATMTRMPASSEPWVGRPLQRVEDDALLRGEGRFLDDLSPVAHSYHAAVVRSQLAHARIAVDASAALDAPGVIGVLTGADVERAVTALPGRDRQRHAAVRHRDRHGAVRRRADRRRRRARPLPRRGRGRARRRRLRPARRRARPGRRSGRRRSRPHVLVRRRRHGDGRGRPRPPPDVPRPSLHLHAGRVLRGRRRLGCDRRAADGLGELPGAVHAARRRGRRARAQGRPSPTAHAARLGRLVRDQVVGVRVHRADGARRHGTSACP